MRVSSEVVYKVRGSPPFPLIWSRQVSPQINGPSHLYSTLLHLSSPFSYGMDGGELGSGSVYPPTHHPVSGGGEEVK